jgi:4-hydroxyacetophenone monooxygenase
MKTLQKSAQDRVALQAALNEADIVPLTMVLAQLTEDLGILDEVSPYIGGAWSFLENIPEALRQKVRTRLMAVLEDYATTGRELPPLPSDTVLQRMMTASVGQKVPNEYLPLLLEEAGFDTSARSVHWRNKAAAASALNFKVIVIGAGFAGLCAAIKLKELGVPFEILEKNDAVGGTWLENKYPGCGVDTPNHVYSFSFYPNHTWTRHFSPRDEILKYINDTVDRFNLSQHIRFGTEVTSATFVDGARWQVTFSDRDNQTHTVLCDAVITAVGQLNRPAIPDIHGLDTFSGPVFHTANWDQSAALEGKRVAMIGTGASALQAGPALAPDLDRLLVFQRTPHWVMHNPNYHKIVSAGNRWALDNIPYFSEWLRFQLFWASSDGFHHTLSRDPAWPTPDISLNEENDKIRVQLIDHMRAELDNDEDLLAKVVPSYPPYGKRVLRDNHWFKMLKRPNVELITDAISHIADDAIVMKGGAIHPVDAIVFSTGFQASRILWPMEIRGLNGLKLRDVWGDDDPRAHLGITTPGFPNFFMTYGPNTNIAHGGSIIFHTECQVRYIMQALRYMIERDHKVLEVRSDVHDDYNRMVDEKHQNMVWAHPGVMSWYKNKRNRVTVTSPWKLLDYWKLTRNFNADDFAVQEPVDSEVRHRHRAS